MEQVAQWIDEQNEEGYTGLLFAASSGNLDMVKVLMRFGCDLDCSNNKGENAIHIAARREFPMIIAYLASCQAALEKLTKDQETPLHAAVLMNSYKSAALLLALGVERNSRDINGQTALHLAALNNNGRIVRLLLFKGCDKTVLDNEGKTAEDLASEKDAKLLFSSSGLLQIFGYKPMISQGGKRNFVPSLTLLLLVVTSLVIDSVFVFNCNP